MKSEAKLNLTLPASPDASGMARQVARAFESYLEGDRAADLSLLVSEVVTNGVRHAEAADPNLIALELAVFNHSVRAEVTDRGTGFFPAVPAEPDRSTPGGWGLYLVEQLADRWGVAPADTTKVWFELDRGLARPPRQQEGSPVTCA